MVDYKVILFLASIISVYIAIVQIYPPTYQSSFRKPFLKNFWRAISVSKPLRLTINGSLGSTYIKQFTPDRTNLFGPTLTAYTSFPNRLKENFNFTDGFLSRGLKHSVQIRSWELRYNKLKNISPNREIKRLPKVFITGEYSLFEDACFLNTDRLRLLWPTKDKTLVFNYSISQRKFAESAEYQHLLLPLYDIRVVDSDEIFDYSTRLIKKRTNGNEMKVINLPGTIHYWLLPYDMPNCWHGFMDHLFPQFKTLLYLIKYSANLNIFPFDAWFLTQAKPSAENYFSGYGACYQFLATMLRGLLTFYYKNTDSLDWDKIPFPALYFGTNDTVNDRQIICVDRLVYRGSGHNTTKQFHDAAIASFPIFRQRIFEFLQYSSSPYFTYRGKEFPTARNYHEKLFRIVIHDRLDSIRRQWVNADDLVRSINPRLLHNGNIHLRYLPSMGTSFTAWEQIGIHLTCDLLIAPHGANLMLTMFMPKNASVIQVGVENYAGPFLGPSDVNDSIASTFSLHQYETTAIPIYPFSNGSLFPNNLQVIIPPKVILQLVRDKLGIELERDWEGEC